MLAKSTWEKKLIFRQIIYLYGEVVFPVEVPGLPTVIPCSCELIELIIEEVSPAFAEANAPWPDDAVFTPPFDAIAAPPLVEVIPSVLACADPPPETEVMGPEDDPPLVEIA